MIQREWDEKNGAKRRGGGRYREQSVLVRSSRLLDKPGFDLRELLHILNSLWDIPYLVRIDHEDTARRPCVLPFDAARERVFPSCREVGRIVNDGADDLPAAEVGLDAGAHLHLEVVEALLERFERQTAHFVVIVPEPASRCDVGWVPNPLDFFLACGFGRGLLDEHFEGFFACDRIGYIPSHG